MSCSSISPTSFHRPGLQRARYEDQPLHTLAASPLLPHAEPRALIPSQERPSHSTKAAVTPRGGRQHQVDPTTPNPPPSGSPALFAVWQLWLCLLWKSALEHRFPRASLLMGFQKIPSPPRKPQCKSLELSPPSYRVPASYLEPFDSLFAAWSKHDTLVEAGDRGGTAGQGRQGGRGADPSDGVGHCGEIVMAVTQLCPSSIIIVLKVGHIYGRGRRDGPGKDTRTGRDRERQRQEKLLGKRKEWSGAARRKLAITRKRHRRQRSGTGSSRARARASLPQPEQLSRSTGQFWEAAVGIALDLSQAPGDGFLQHQILQPSGLGSTVLPKSVPLPLPSSPAGTAWGGFPARLSQISWIWGQRMRREGEERQWPATLQTGCGDGAGGAMGSPCQQSPSTCPLEQPERQQSEGRVATHPLQAAALACQHPEHQLPPDPMAKGLGYQTLLQPQEVTGARCAVLEAGRAQVSGYSVSHPSPLAHVRGS